ncbi:response regulator [Cardiobacteriaceae bacterium TAE3-ERU3]|nr:response regulator [Cardiobacteriaceae bacterium TAE3-ERU3]
MAAQNLDKKVLVVDDSTTIRRTAESMLGKEGYVVETASDGFQALAKIVEFKPDIIFLDIMMPRLDGYQVCSIVKSNPEYKHIPVLLLTSKDSIFDQAKGRIAGSEYFMTKPFSRDELLQGINEHLVGK